MKIVIVLVSLLAVGLAEEREDRQAPIYPADTSAFPIYPAASSSDFVRNPLLPYLLNYNNPLFRQLAARQSNATSTLFRNSTITVVCTVSTTACASGRRRRHVLAELLDQQFDEIQPSAVEKIEVTASAVDLTNDRERREADPQLFVPSHPNFYSPDASFGHIRNNLRQNIQLPSFMSSIPFFAQGFNLASNFAQQFGPPIVVNNLNNALAAILSGNLPTNAWIPGLIGDSRASVARTVTQTSCIFVVTTSTSTPSCSTPGSLLQCVPATATAGK